TGRYVSVYLARLCGGDWGRVGVGDQAQGATRIAPLPAERCAGAHVTIAAAPCARTSAIDGDALATRVSFASPNRSRLSSTSVTLLSGRTLAIARFGWGEVAALLRGGRG